MQVSSESKDALSTERAFCIGWDLDHLLPDLDVDGWLDEFPDAPDYSTFWRIKKRLELPERIEFAAVGEILDVIDYPYTDVDWPIMSKKMLSTLLSIGNFQHIVYPIVMAVYKMTYDLELKKHTPALQYENHNYVVVHVLEDLDSIVDLDNSIFSYSKINPSIVDITTFKKLVFKEPVGGFPPLFRVPPFDNRLYVSAEAQVALEAAGIRGVRFARVSDDRTVKTLP